MNKYTEAPVEKSLVENTNNNEIIGDSKLELVDSKTENVSRSSTSVDEITFQQKSDDKSNYIYITTQSRENIKTSDNQKSLSKNSSEYLDNHEIYQEETNSYHRYYNICQNESKLSLPVPLREDLQIHSNSVSGYNNWSPDVQSVSYTNPNIRLQNEVEKTQKKNC